MSEDGLEIVPPSTEAHWSVGVIERANQTLRHTFEKLRVNPVYTDWGKTSLIAIATHFVNAMITNTSTSAFLLVFGQVPRFLMGPQGDSPPAQDLSNGQRIWVMNAARLAAEKSHARMRYLEFKRRNTPSDFDNLEPVRMCMLFREGHRLNLRSKSAITGQWTGPHIYLGRRGGRAMVLLRGEVHFAAASHFKPAPASDDVDDLGVRPVAVDNGELLATKPRPKRTRHIEMEDAVVFSSLCRENKHADLDGEFDCQAHTQENGLLRDSLQQALATSSGLKDQRLLYVNVREVGTLGDRSEVAVDVGDKEKLVSYDFGDLGPSAQSIFSETVENRLAEQCHEISNVFITKVVTKEHPAYVASRADAATDGELRAFLDMEAIEISLADGIPNGSNIVDTRIILVIKELGTPEERWKIHLVIQGCVDRDSGGIVAESGCVFALAVRLLLIVGLDLNFGFWSRDLKQAFLQSGKLTRDIYAGPPKGFRDKLRGYFLKIISPVYGLKKAFCYW